MKTILTLTCIMSFLGLCSRNKYGVIAEGENEKPKGNLIEYQYSYHVCMAYPQRYFNIKANEDGVMTLSFSEQSNDEIRVMRIPDDALKAIQDTAQKYELYKIKQSFRPTAEVLDGDGWGLQLTYEDGYIFSGGSNASAFGKGSEGHYAILKYVEELLEKTTPADSLGIRYHSDR